MSCLVAGANFLLRAIRDEAFTFRHGVKQFVSMEEDEEGEEVADSGLGAEAEAEGGGPGALPPQGNLARTASGGVAGGAAVVPPSTPSPSPSEAAAPAPAAATSAASSSSSSSSLPQPQPQPQLQPCPSCRQPSPAVLSPDAPPLASPSLPPTVPPPSAPPPSASASTSLYPYLLVNIGSGVSMVRVDGRSAHARVSGTNLGEPSRESLAFPRPGFLPGRPLPFPRLTPLSPTSPSLLPLATAAQAEAPSGGCAAS